MNAADRCALSYKLLLEFTSKEHHRWYDWFTEHPKAWHIAFASGRMATIGGVVLHIFGVELRYAQRLLDQDVTTWEEFTQSSIDEVFALGDHARSQLVQFFTSAPETELDRVLTFQTLTAGTVTASKYKIASNIFLHDIRHWGQIATVLRQNGFTDQWSHDMLLSEVQMWPLDLLPQIQMANVTIEIRKNGPYRVYGDPILVDHEGNPIPVPEGKRKTAPDGKSWISLCRCGGSVTKPFCDGTHSRIGFIGAQEAVEKTEANPPSP